MVLGGDSERNGVHGGVPIRADYVYGERGIARHSGADGAFNIYSFFSSSWPIGGRGQLRFAYAKTYFFSLSRASTRRD